MTEKRTGNTIEVIGLGGELDVTQKQALTARLSRAGNAEITIVDLSAVTYIDSAALTVFIEHLKEAQRSSRDLRFIVARAQPIHRIFEVTGLTRLFKLYENQEQAKRG